jgi:GDP-L-fucose synthase
MHLMLHYNEKLFVNIGTGEDLSIKALAEMVREIIGFEGNIRWNTEKPDGTPRKLMDVSRIQASGWKHRISLHSGITSVYEDFKTKELTELRAK